MGSEPFCDTSIPASGDLKGEPFCAMPNREKMMPHFPSHGERLMAGKGPFRDRDILR